MPVRIPDDLPASKILAGENIFFMPESRAVHQDIRPLEIAILNLMPTKITTETQILRLLGNSPLQVNITLVHTSTHKSLNTPEDHLLTFYETFDQIQKRKFDGLIITGAPVEQMDFEDVDYWPELLDIMHWKDENVFSTLFICWGAQAGLYHHYGVPKYPLSKKMFGVFPHYITKKNVRLLRGFDEYFYVPVSRHTEVRQSDIEKVPQLESLALSEEAGVYIVASKDRRRIFATGHSEYDPLTLKSEYDRDVQKGLPIKVPKNYFPQDDPTQTPMVRWRSHAHLLFSNWLNYYVYQTTPFQLEAIPKACADADETDL